jgi:hypothetical protein
VKAFKTKSGNTRFVLVDDEGNEYSTFKEQIAAKLPGLEGKPARGEEHAGGSDADEIGWKTAMEAAPYLLSSEAVDEEVPPEELFEKLQPFKELVAEDIEGDGADS